MIEVKEITIEEFKDTIYNKYLEIFPKNEQRSISELEKTYNEKILKFYKVTLDDKTIGFYILDRIKDYPYFAEFYALFDEYQDKGYGTKAINYLLDNIVKEDGLIGEIEKVTEDNEDTIRRLRFYERLGFHTTGSEYFVKNVSYNTMINIDKYSKEELDNIFFDYYKIIFGEENLGKLYKLIK